MKKLTFMGLITFLVLLFPVSHSSAEEDIDVVIDQEPVNFEHQLFIHEGHVYVPLRELSERLKIKVYYDSETRMITLNHPKLNLEISLGSDKLIVKDGTSYVPVRFINEELGAKVSWDGQTRTVYVQSDSQFAYGTVDDYSIWVAYQNGEVYMSEGNEYPDNIGSINHELYDIVTINGAEMENNAIALKVYDLYGAPHIHNRIYTMVINNNEIVKQEDVYFMHRYESQDLLLYNDLAILNSGKVVNLVNAKGETVQEIDLSLGNEQNYDLIKLAPTYMLIRGNDDGYLLYVNRETGERVVLYKELIDNQEEIKYIEDDGKQVPGDQLEFIDEQDGTLIFSYDGLFEEGTYKYNISN